MNMPFKRGFSGNPKGRKKGSANKTTAEIRDQLKTAFGDTLERLPDKLKAMDYDKQIELLKTFLPFILPKPIEPPESTTAESIQPPNVTFCVKDMSLPPNV